MQREVDRFLETFSEKKRGRPRSVPQNHLSIVRAMFPDISTERGRHNAAYCQRAICLLVDYEEFRWLLSSEEDIMAGHGHMRRTLLGELGRIGEDQDLIDIALAICQLKPTAKHGVRMIRDWRNGGAKPGDVGVLTDRFVDLLNDYVDAHPDMTPAQVLMALTRASSAVRNSRSTEDDG